MSDEDCYNGDHRFEGERGVVCTNCGYRIYPRCYDCGAFVRLDRGQCDACAKREEYENLAANIA